MMDERDPIQHHVNAAVHTIRLLSNWYHLCGVRGSILGCDCADHKARKDRQQDRRDEVRCSHVHEPVLGLTTLKICANLTTHTKRKVD